MTSDLNQPPQPPPLQLAAGCCTRRQISGERREPDQAHDEQREKAENLHARPSRLARGNTKDERAGGGDDEEEAREREQPGVGLGSGSPDDERPDREAQPKGIVR